MLCERYLKPNKIRRLKPLGIKGKIISYKPIDIVGI